MGNGVNKVPVEYCSEEVPRKRTMIIVAKNVTFASPIDRQRKPDEQSTRNTDVTSDVSSTITDSPKKSNLKRKDHVIALLDSRNFSQYEIEALNAHNFIRYKHGVKALILNKDLCKMAREHARELIDHREFHHSDRDKRHYNGKECGENIAAFGVINGLMGYPGYTAVYQWYDEMEHFNFKNPVYSQKSRHFTQLVWPHTTDFGQACAKRKEGRWTHYIAVAFYYPKGNIRDQMHIVPSPVVPRELTKRIVQRF